MSEIDYTVQLTSSARYKALTSGSPSPKRNLNETKQALPAPHVAVLLPSVCGTTEYDQALSDLRRTLADLCANCPVREGELYAQALRWAGSVTAIDQKIRAVRAWLAFWQKQLVQRQALEAARNERRAVARQYSRQRMTA